MSSNVFVLPQATDTIYASRPLLNDAMQLLLQNFYRPTPPTANSVVIDGVESLQSGMLWVQEGNSNVSSRVFLYDPSMSSHPLYSGFTREGLGHISYDTFANANAALNSSYLQAGELVRIQEYDRVFLVSNDRTSLIDLGTSGSVENANNATFFNGLPDTQYVRTDRASTMNATISLSSTGTIVVGNLTMSNASSRANLYTSRGSLVFNTGANETFVDVFGGMRSTHYVETANNMSSLSGLETIDCSRGNIFYGEITGNTTIQFSNVPVSGNAYSCVLIFTMNNTTSNTITWPASVRWAKGIEPVAMDISQTDIYTMTTRDGGSIWYGVISGEAFA